MANVDTIAEVADLTLVLDPAELWPDAESCPDWPIVPPNYQGSVVSGRGPAERHLAEISQRLNRAPGRLRQPTPKERAALRAEHFTQGHRPSVARFGVTGLQPVHPYSDGQAPLIAEAAQVRGYLRKLDIREAAAVEAKEARRVADLQHRVDHFVSSRAEIEKGLGEAAEGAARHRQRIADEKAFHDEINMKRHLSDAFREAVSAAQSLGIDPPSRPEAVT